MGNQVSVVAEAYANSSSAERKFGSVVVPMMFTCPRKTSPALGEEIATVGESCAARRKNRKGKRARYRFISRTSKFNMKHRTGQIPVVNQLKCTCHSPVF